MMNHYIHKNVSLARKLRKDMTPWERKLWYDFLSQYEIRFQRQKAIGNYIVDFYCHKAGLVIELDGSQHCEDNEIAKDKIRTDYLGSLGLDVFRISNLDINNNFAGVCEKIDEIVKGKIEAVVKQHCLPLEGGGCEADGRSRTRIKTKATPHNSRLKA